MRSTVRSRRRASTSCSVRCFMEIPRVFSDPVGAMGPGENHETDNSSCGAHRVGRSTAERIDRRAPMDVVRAGGVPHLRSQARIRPLRWGRDRACERVRRGRGVERRERRGRGRGLRGLVPGPGERHLSLTRHRHDRRDGCIVDLDGARPAEPGPPGTSARSLLPKSLTGLTNGQLPDAVLEPIGQGNHRLEHRAALAFRRMADAATQEGVQLEVSDSYRSLADQTRTAGDVGLYRDGGLAAVPGTSTHGWGLSVDLETDPRTTQWLRSNATRWASPGRGP